MGLWGLVEQRFETSDDALPERADVIIVLGAALSKDGRGLSPQSCANLERALALVAEWRSNTLLFVGGNGVGALTEADAMARCVADRWVYVERRSHNTRTNALYALPIMRSQGWRHAIVVAQQWHARRVRATFRKQWRGSGVQFAVVKARSPYGGASQMRFAHFVSFLLWDTFAFAVYKIFRWC